MSTEPDTHHESESDTEIQPATAVPERYAALETGDGDVVIYDRDVPSAWLQSDSVVDTDR